MNCKIFSLQEFSALYYVHELMTTILLFWKLRFSGIFLFIVQLTVYLRSYSSNCLNFTSSFQKN